MPPAGRVIAWTTDRDRPRERRAIYAMHDDGSGAVRIAGGPGFHASPAWRPG